MIFGNPFGVVDNVLDYYIVVSKFKLHSDEYPRKTYELYASPITSNGLNSTSPAGRSKI